MVLSAVLVLPVMAVSGHSCCSISSSSSGDGSSSCSSSRSGRSATMIAAPHALAATSPIACC